jgi:hypothetical protein
VDTGSDLCVFPRKLLPGRRERTLYAANGTTIPTYGWISQSLILGLRREFTWRFVVADVQLPIVGVDLLSYYGLLVDCRHNRLLDGVTSLSNPVQTAPASVPSVKTIASDTTTDCLLAEFPELTRPTGIHREVRHNTRHHIRTTPGPPVACRPRRLAPDRLAVAKAEFDAMLRDGTARRAEGPWSSVLHLVPKKDSGWRPCEDYRALNARTIPDRYPIRHIQDYSHHLSGCTMFSKIDLVRAYQLIPVHPDDVPKSAITNPFVLFEFPFMSFGLRNAVQTFQRFMDEIIGIQRSDLSDLTQLATAETRQSAPALHWSQHSRRDFSELSGSAPIQHYRARHCALHSRSTRAPADAHWSTVPATGRC